MTKRFREYTKVEILAVIMAEHVGREDFTYLSALSNYALVGYNPETNDSSLAGIKCVDVKVVHTDRFPTGIFHQLGTEAVIVLNEEESILDYDLLSEMHPMHDWDVYLWLSDKWANEGTDLGIHGEWYRRDVYPDGIEPFNGKLGWADLPPAKGEV